MSAATEFDVGPLNWVKSEIDLALVRASEALQNYTDAKDNAGDLTQIKFCRTHLHQVQGALTIVGIDGVTQFVEALESLLAAFEAPTYPTSPEGIALVKRALNAIQRYLDELAISQVNQPLRLLPLYREVQIARGITHVVATDLFFPDLGVRPPHRIVQAPTLSHDERQHLFRHERARFQHGLLAWLRMPQEKDGVIDMLDAVKRIEATQRTPATRSFWWVAIGFLSALAEGAIAVDGDVKQLCARIDAQIRRLLAGPEKIPERLMRDVLYVVANTNSSNETVQTIKTAYQLQAAIPSLETMITSSVSDPHDATHRRLRETIAAAQDAWNKFSAGTTPALPAFKEHTLALSALVEQLGHTDYRRLAQAIVAVTNWLSEQPSRQSEVLGMEIATAILLTQNAQENFQRLGNDFAHQVDVMVARIHGCIAGNPPQPGSETPALDDMSREAQEKLLTSQVAKEIQSNLGQIEQALDSFFRDAENRTELPALDTALRQIIGALTMMRHDGAVAVLQQCAADIKRFATPSYFPQQADFERVANELSTVGFFIDALPQGVVDFASFVRKLRAAPEDLSEENVEPAIVQQKRETQNSLNAFQDTPGDVELRQALKQNPTAPQDAQPAADKALEQQTEAILSALVADEEIAPSPVVTATALQAQALEAPLPSPETLQLAQASDETIDAELLSIFLEEAHDVLDNIDESLKLLHEQTYNVDVLMTIRRGFHTLKGSGRMVGLKTLGELAWAIEQVLNLWLRRELEVSMPLFELLEKAHTDLTVWVAYLETHTGGIPDTQYVLALAEALRSNNDELISPISAVSSIGVPTRTPEAPSVSQEEIAPLQSATPSFDVSPAVSAKELLTVSAALDNGEDTKSDTDSTDFEFSLEVVTPELAVEPGNISVTTEVADIVDKDSEIPPEVVGDETISTAPTLHEIFHKEAHGHLLTLQRDLLLFEADMSIPTPNTMHLAAHTLAGIAGALGFSPINRLALALEHALQRRDQTASPSSLEAFVIIRQTVAELELMLTAVAEARDPEPSPRLLDALGDLYCEPLAESEHVSPVETVAPDDALLFPEPLKTAPWSMAVPPLRDEFDAQLLPIFIEEALDLNQNIAKTLRAWRADPTNADMPRALTRLLHTFKGSARMTGAMNLGAIAHAIETHIEAAIASEHTEAITLELIDEIDNAHDIIIQGIDHLQNDESSVLSPSEQSAAIVPTHVAEGTPADLGNQLTPVPQSLPEAAAETAVQQRIMLRVRADLIDRLVNESGELSIARARIEGGMRGLKESLLDLTENVIRLRRQLRDIEIQAESQMQSRTAQADEHHAGFDPLEFDRFTRFQELTRMMAESVNDVATVQQNLFKNLDDANAAILAQARLNREVQQQLMAVRMLPFNGVADRLYRIVRQTAKELGKRVNLEIHGGQIEVDRSVLEKIVAPLEHMLRNAIAHGLENRDARIAQGKSEIGEITLTLTREGNEIVIDCADDGAGLNLERIRQRGVEVGLLAAEDAANSELAVARLHELIFTPGFSTASELSQIAGRGVGMDVVKTEIAELGGRIEVDSAPGKGTMFRLYIPLTMAVTQAVLVRAGNRLYAMPSVMVEQVRDVKEAELTEIREAGAIEWMGRRYSFHYLPQLLGDMHAAPEVHRQYWILLLRSGNQRIALQVDALKGNQEIVIKNIGPQLARVVGIDGATVLGDGQVVLILNPVALVDARRATFAYPAPVPAVQTSVESAATLPTVMVVDDSLTVRKITGRLLAREGYEVMVAKDGVDALEQLLDVLPDVMLVDIEMPRMDGFDLTRHVRADSRLRNIPIIMITSRTADKHRNYAFEIGVNHYLGKPYQEEALLRLVADYVKTQRAQADLTTA